MFMSNKRLIRFVWKHRLIFFLVLILSSPITLFGVEIIYSRVNITIIQHRIGTEENLHTYLSERISVGMKKSEVDKLFIPLGKSCVIVKSIHDEDSENFYYYAINYGFLPLFHHHFLVDYDDQFRVVRVYPSD